MPELLRVECNRFGNLTVQNPGLITLVKGVDTGFPQEVGLRVVPRMFEEVEQGKPGGKHERWAKELEKEAQNLYLLENEGLSVPSFIGLVQLRQLFYYHKSLMV